QEKKLPEPPPASEDAQRRAEQIAQDVEDDGSWQIPPEEPKRERPKPLHAPVIVPPPISHFTDEPSQNPAVRMRDRLEEDALPKPDMTRKPTQIRSASGTPGKKKKHRRADPGITDVRKQIHVKSTAGATGPAAPVLADKKKTGPRIRIPDELPPDIPRVIPGQNDLPEDLDELVEAASRKPAEVIQHKREAQVRSRAELIREQMRMRAEEAAAEPSEETGELNTEEPAQAEQQPEPLPPLEPVRLVSRPVAHIPASQQNAPVSDEDKPSFFSKFKVFMTDFLDLHDEDEEEEPKPKRPRKKAADTPVADVPAEEAAPAEKKPLFGGLKETFQKLTHKDDAAPKPAVFGSLLKKQDDDDDVREYHPKGQKADHNTDWRSLLHTPGSILTKQKLAKLEAASEEADAVNSADTAAEDTTDDALARAYDALEMAETDTPLAEDKPQIPDEIIALLQVPGVASMPSPDASRKMFTAEDFMRDDPLDEPMQDSLQTAAANPEAEPESQSETPSDAPDSASEEAGTVPQHAESAKRKKRSRLRNLISFDEEEAEAQPETEPELTPEDTASPIPEADASSDSDEAVPEEAPDTADESDSAEDTAEAEEADDDGAASAEEEAPESLEGLAAMFREALDESPGELAAMKAEPLPESDGNKVQFLRRHWYFLAGILCFILAIVGLVTSIIWFAGQARRFFGSSTLRENLTKVLYPVAVVDMPAFETTADLSADSLLSAAMVDILMYDDLSAYPVSYDVISIPANDVLARAQLRFGTDFTTEFTTLHAAGETFYYDSASGCYNVPAAPAIFSYSPEIAEVSRSGDTYTVNVRYISEKASWQEKSANFTENYAKTMQVTLQQENDNYRILRIANVAEEGAAS
ncbi:MAG: hypothetical protein IKN55_01730, partial [Oscillospiraceae bacterium]|nr:hypothetical protein [Oscillospiraceae bacterium]